MTRTTRPIIAAQDPGDIRKLSDLIEVAGSRPQLARWQVGGTAYAWRKGCRHVDVEEGLSRRRLPLDGDTKAHAKRAIFADVRGDAPASPASHPALSAQQADGIPSLLRLIEAAKGDSGHARTVGRFLLGLSGQGYRFDLAELRGLDADLHADCLAVLRLDQHPGREVRQYVESGADVWEWLRARHAPRVATESPCAPGSGGETEGTTASSSASCTAGSPGFSRGAPLTRCRRWGH